MSEIHDDAFPFEPAGGQYRRLAVYPVTTGLRTCSAQELGININKHGFAVVYPCVSGYIGADTVAAVLSSGMYETEDISLLIDIGTNGEIVLGGKNRLYACSTAAGPAFEGANIRHGIGG